VTKRDLQIPEHLGFCNPVLIDAINKKYNNSCAERFLRRQRHAATAGVRREQIGVIFTRHGTRAVSRFPSFSDAWAVLSSRRPLFHINRQFRDRHHSCEALLNSDATMPMLPSTGCRRMTLGTRILIVVGKIARPITLVAVIAVVIFASYIFTPSESIFNEPLREITPRQLLTVALTILMWIFAIYVCIFFGCADF
jgi:hypothetical protein